MKKNFKSQSNKSDNMNAQQIAHFIDNATPQQKAVFNNNAGGITIANINESGINEEERSKAMDAADSISSVSISDVNSYATDSKIKDIPC